MDFSKVLSVASQNKRHAEKGSKVKRYTTEVSAPKKPPKSNVQSDAVKAFLAKKAAEERRREIDAERQKRELLELRNAARGHKRIANAMTRRTKDNNFMAGFLIKPEGGQTPRSPAREGFKSPPRHPYAPSNAPPGRILKGDKRWVEVPKTATAPPPPPEPKSKMKYTPAPSNYHDLLKLAYNKQFVPVEDPVTKKKEVPIKVKEETGETMRLMRKDEKQRYLEEQARKSGKPLPVPAEPAKNRNKNIPAKKKPSNPTNPPETFRIPSLKECPATSNVPRGNGSTGKVTPVQRVNVNVAAKKSEPPPKKNVVGPPARQSAMPNARTQGRMDGGRQTAPVPSSTKGALKPTACAGPGPQRRPVPLGGGGGGRGGGGGARRPDMGRVVSKGEQSKLNSSNDVAKRGQQLLPKCSSAKASTTLERNSKVVEKVVKVVKAKDSGIGGKQPPSNSIKPRVFPPVEPRQFPPVEPRQFPPRDMIKRPQPPTRPPLKRRIESDEEDDEMADFIDDTPIPESEDYSKHIRDIFGYDRRRFQCNDEEEEEDARFMESSFVEQMREEARSARLGLLEDLEDIQREEEELKQELIRRKKKKK